MSCVLSFASCKCILSGHTPHTIQFIGVNDFIQSPTILHTIDIVNRALNYVVSVTSGYRLRCCTIRGTVQWQTTRFAFEWGAPSTSRERGLASYYHLGNMEDSI